MATQKKKIMQFADKYKEYLDEWEYLRIKAFCGESQTLKQHLDEKHEDMDTFDIDYDTIVTICDYEPSIISKEDKYYDEFYDYIMSNVNLVKGETEDNQPIADYTEFIKRNYNALKNFSKEYWTRDYDDDELTEQWINEIQLFLAGEGNEEIYKNFLTYMQKPDDTQNPAYSEFIENEIINRLPINKNEFREIFLGEVDNDLSGKALNAELEKVVGEKRMPHHNRIYNQDLLMEFAGFSKTDNEYTIHNDVSDETIIFNNDDEIYDYLIENLKTNEGKNELYSYDKKPDILIERVEHFDFDRISYEVVKIYPPQNDKAAAVLANPKFEGGKISECGLFQTYDTTEDAFGAMHDLEVQIERNKVYNDVMKVVSDIEKNINACYTSDFHYDMDKAIEDTVSTYGRNKTMTVAAIMILDRQVDGRISHDNKDWANNYLNTLDDDNISHIKDKVHNGSVHSILLEGFVKDLRRETFADAVQQIDYEEENIRKH